MTSVPAVAYVRVSAVGKRDVESASYQTEQEQAERAEAFARSQGYDLRGTITDRDVSGGKWDRRGLDEVIERAESGEVRAVIVYRMSRLGRSLRGVLETIERLQAAGCAVLSVKEALDLSTSQGRLMLNVLASFDEYELEVRKEYWQATKSRAFGRGVHLGSTPFGYLRGPDRRLVPDPDVAPLIVELYERRAAGEAFRKLAVWLNTKRKAPRGGDWTVTQTCRLLRNRVYLGEVQWEGQVTVAAHEPIVPAELFARVQGRDVGPKVSAQAKRRFLLRGVVRCAGCGRTMVGKTRNGTKAGARPIYHCKSSNQAVGCPAPAYITAEPLEEAIAAAVLARMAGDVAVGGEVEADLPALRLAASEAEAEVMEYLADTAMRQVLGDQRWRTGLEARVRASDEARAALEAAESTGPEVALAPADVASDPELLALAIGGAVREVTVTRGRGDDRFTVAWR